MAEPSVVGSAGCVSFSPGFACTTCFTANTTVNSVGQLVDFVQSISQWPKNNHNRMITGMGTPSSQSKSPRPIVSSMKTLSIQKRKK
jgi:hypothetical protein